jgi:hypothetical protein
VEEAFSHRKPWSSVSFVLKKIFEYGHIQMENLAQCPKIANMAQNIINVKNKRFLKLDMNIFCTFASKYPTNIY